MENVIQVQPMRRSGPIDQNLIGEITQDALRRAAMAPTYMEALDITGAALLAVAAVSRMGESGRAR
ncbi:hypothetical protein [Paraburkholderia heleia]|uniref:hypothetical protein n=1 Tax=Paraburkholderia heleia TaxID=634127 RepID=UPI002AB66CE5|nr:hypothetical protein [Paraburkholderia heleia]